MANETTIPILPCNSINDTLEFYVALGFEVTYQQARPNTYACVKYEDINLHFFTMKGYEPKNSYSTCFIQVADLASLHLTFSNNLRHHYGKLPIAGIPRISKLNTSNADKELRFNIIDPGGNWIRFGQPGKENSERSDGEPQNKLARITQAADWLVEAKGDFEKAAHMLDNALAQHEPTPPVDRVQAMVLRASVAISLDDSELAKTLLSEIRQLPLEAHETTALEADLQRASELEKLLGN